MRPYPILFMLLLAVGLAVPQSASAGTWSPQECIACHTTFPDAHPLHDCEACHSRYDASKDPGDGHYWTADRPAGSCVGGTACHANRGTLGNGYDHGHWLGYGEPPGPFDYYPRSPISHYLNRYSAWDLRVYECDLCHSSEYPHVPQHDDAALEIKRQTLSEGVVADAEDVQHLGSAVTYTQASYSEDDSGELVALDDDPASEDSADLLTHGNYTASSTKCGMCHSVHRAAGDGESLLPVADASCAGCHRAGSTTVTAVVVNWESGGPHGAGDDARCMETGCHTDNPHGVGGSRYAIVAAKLLSPRVDELLEAAAADPRSGITEDELNGFGSWDEATRSAVRTGYSCNVEGCHFQSMTVVLSKDYSEDRWASYGTSLSEYRATVSKTGHLTVAEANNETAFRAVESCVSCHDQTDTATLNEYGGGTTVSGYTFPHSQTPLGVNNTDSNRAWLWMTIAGNAGGDDFGYMRTPSDKAKDGACLKCHRSAGNAAGIGIDR